jgi:hypothetical protein
MKGQTLPYQIQRNKVPESDGLWRYTLLDVRDKRTIGVWWSNNPVTRPRHLRLAQARLNSRYYLDELAVF